MNRIVSIFIVCAAAVAMLLAIFVPHHHHDGEFCTEITEHTEDNDATGSENHGYCVAEIEYTDRLERKDEGGGCGLSNCAREGHTYLFPIVYLFASFVPDDSETDFGKYIIHYYPAYVPSEGAGRAPPVTLC